MNRNINHHQKLSLFKSLQLYAAFVLLLGLAACSNNSNESSNGSDSAANASGDHTGMNAAGSNAPADHALATLSGTKPDTTVSGTVQFDKDGNAVKMTLQISVPKMANKSVAVHIHDHGDCGDMGKDAMGHWNPTNEKHGKWGSGEFHSGDFGNINLDANGNGTLQLTSERWSIGGDAKTDVLGKSIIVHSGVDDYTSQPSGNSGERIGCGVIGKKA